MGESGAKRRVREKTMQDYEYLTQAEIESELNSVDEYDPISFQDPPETARNAVYICCLIYLLQQAFFQGFMPLWLQ